MGSDGVGISSCQGGRFVKKGEYQRVSFIRTAHCAPRSLLLHLPFAHCAPRFLRPCGPNEKLRLLLLATPAPPPLITAGAHTTHASCPASEQSPQRLWDGCCRGWGGPVVPDIHGAWCEMRGMTWT